MKKKMRKVKKHWVVVSVAGLALLGASGSMVIAEEVSDSSTLSTVVDVSVSTSTEAVSTDTEDSSQTVVSSSDEHSESTTDLESTDVLTDTSSSDDSSSTTTTDDTTSSDDSSSTTTTDGTTSSDDSTSTTKTEVTTDSDDNSTTTSSENTSDTDTSKSTDTISDRSKTITEISKVQETTKSTIVENSDKTSDTDASKTALVEATVSGKTLTIHYNGKISKKEVINFAVWTKNKGQDDLVWYQADAAGAAYIDLSKHKEYGVYNIHTYSSRYGGLNAMTVTVASPNVKTSITKTSNAHFDILVSNVPSSITSVTIPVWSSKNNQDDIKWYTAKKVSSGTYKVSVAAANHKGDRGHYNAHIYGQSSITGGQVGLAVTSGFDNVDTRANATVSMVNYAENKTKFNVVVAGSSSTKEITGVSVAVWSVAKGQDDLKWYTPKVSNNKATATVDIANHSNTSDHYNVHVYVDYSDGTRSGTVLGSYKITKPVEKNNVTATLTNKGIALKLDSNVVSDYSKVKFAVWSASKGQDDIKWYDASSKGTAVALYENHSGYGSYNIHTYSFENGKAKGLNTTKITIDSPKVSTTIVDNGDMTYTVTVKDVPMYISSVTVPTWSNKKNQDDIVWTATTQSGKTTYVAKVALKDHNYDTGSYSVHVYGQSKLGGDHTVGLAVTKGFKVDEKQIEVSKPTITVTSYDAKAGKVTVLISETSTSKAIKSVNIAAWSKSNQSNIHWYGSSKVVNGKVSITVDEKYHSYITGNYNIHAYVNFTDDTTSGYVVGTYKLNAPKVGSASQGNYDVVNKVIYLDAGHGGADSGAYYHNTTEKSLNLAMQKLLVSKLQSLGYTVVTTRTTDTYVDLLDRSSAANSSNSDIFVSIHFNASTNTDASGIETYYYQYYSDYPSKINTTYHNNSTRLSLSSTLASSIQSATVASTGAKNNGVQRNTFAVLRETTAPAVLVELGYMTNNAEFSNISSRSYQEKLATGVVKGIQSYYKKLGAS